MGSLVSHIHTPPRQIWDEFAAGLKLGRWRMNMGRDKAELDRLEGSWLGGCCLPQLSEQLRARSDPFSLQPPARTVSSAPVSEYM